jgi:lipoate-protein ligase A
MRLVEAIVPEFTRALALDEALLLQAESEGGDEVLRLWEWPRLAVVLGAGCSLAADVDEAACRADGVPIVRRSSGGGTVLLGPGCLLYSLVLSYQRDPSLTDIQGSYRYIFDRIAAALGLGDPAGTSDLAVLGRKFSGNAQQRKRHHLLHHGTLLYAFDLDCVARYLRPPPRQPEYRAGRSHADFLCNLPMPIATIRHQLIAAWQAEPTDRPLPEAQVARLVTEKYGNVAWTRRR